MTRTARRAAILPLAAALVAAVAAPAQAQHGGLARGGRVVTSGTCSAGSVWKLKLKTEDAGRIGVEMEVDQNRNGVRWVVTMRRPGGAAIVHRAYRTAAPSGSFTARASIADRAGADTVVAVATRAGETCTARATL